MIFLAFWLGLALIGALAIGLAAMRMRQQWRENRFVPALARLLGAVALLCLGLVWLAVRGIESYRGVVSPGALILTVFLLPTVATGIHFAALTLGLIEQRALPAARLLDQEQHVKPWSQSRTLILNGVVSLISLLTALATLFAGPEMAALGVPPEIARYASIALLVLSVINMWLRTLTSQPVGGASVDRAEQ